jgi:hypothetical protein
MVESRWDVVDVGGDAMLLFVAIHDGPGPFPAVVVNQGLGSSLPRPCTTTVRRTTFFVRLAR